MILLHFSLFVGESHVKFTRLVHDEVCGFVLITEGMSSNDDGFFPSSYKPWYILDDDGLSEYGPSQDVSDSAIW